MLMMRSAGVALIGRAGRSQIKCAETNAAVLRHSRGCTSVRVSGREIAE